MKIIPRIHHPYIIPAECLIPAANNGPTLQSMDRAKGRWDVLRFDSVVPQSAMFHFRMPKGHLVLGWNPCYFEPRAGAGHIMWALSKDKETFCLTRQADLPDDTYSSAVDLLSLELYLGTKP